MFSCPSRGNVLPIGGLNEKLLSAKRIGIKTVLIPFDNQRDVEDISDDIKKDIKKDVKVDDKKKDVNGDDQEDPGPIDDPSVDDAGDDGGGSDDE